MGRGLYYCNECKKIMPRPEDVYFAEQGFYRCFCSEECIFRFFTPLMIHLEEEENTFRNRLGITNDLMVSQEKFQSYIKSTVEDPDEIWSSPRDGGEEIYTLISKLETREKGAVYIILLIFTYEGRPSLTLLATLTQHEKLVQKYRIGSKIGHLKENLDFGLIGPDPNNANPLNLDEITLEILESKKEKMYDLLMKNVGAQDIPITEYDGYQKYLPITLDDPDEVYEELKDGDVEFVTCIKNFDDGEKKFFYIAISYYYESNPETQEEVLIPIFSFPSQDSKIYKLFQIGQRVNGPSLN